MGSGGHRVLGARRGLKPGPGAWRVTLCVLCLFSLLGISGCGARKKARPARYYDRERGFSLQLPEGWERRAPIGGLALLALSPAEGPRDRFRENVDVAVDSLPRGMTLEDYFKRGRAALAKSSRGFREIARGKADLGGANARWLVFEHRQEGRELKVLSFFLVGDGQGYVLTFTALQDTYAHYERAFEAIARGFRLDR